MESKTEYEARLNIASANRILLNEMMRENEESIRKTKLKIRAIYIETGSEEKENRGFTTYGISCNDTITSLSAENEIYVKRVNETKMKIQVLKKENKVYNIIRNENRKQDYLTAFMAAAEILLDKQQFVDLEDKALSLIIKSKNV